MRTVTRLVSLTFLLLCIPATFAQQLAVADLDRPNASRGVERPVEPSVPVLPMPFACPSARDAISVEPAWQPVSALAGPPSAPDEEMVALPLSAGLSILSIPLRTDSQKLSEILPNLPPGTRAWTWEASSQQFRESLDAEVALGQGFVLYLPVPTILIVSGRRNVSSDIPIELQGGWNLVGVPYEMQLMRSMQRVYVGHVKNGFNEAVAAGAIGSRVYTFDVNGYAEVDEAGSFEPLHGYWIYSSEPQLLELVPPLLSDPGSDTLVGLGLKWAGSGLVSAGINFGMSTVLAKMGLGPGEDMKKEFEKISAQLQQVIDTQETILRNIAELKTHLDSNTQQVLQRIDEDAYIGPVRTQLASHFDDGFNTAASLKWFLTKAQAGTDVPLDTRSQFALDVLTNWKFIDQFNTINTAIMGATDTNGVLDTIAAQIMLNSDKNTMKDSYAAMEAYFNKLVGMQIKCGTLVMNAKTQLSTDPKYQSLYTAQDALGWKNETFYGTIRKEVEYYRTVVERVALHYVILPQSVWDPPVKLPEWLMAQPAAGSKPTGNILWMADYLVANMLDEPAGLRVRAITSPDYSPGPQIWFQQSGATAENTQALPALSQWRTIPGPLNYDSWSYAGTWPDGMRQFRFTNQWKAATARIGSVTAANYTVTLDPSDDFIAWWPATTGRGGSRTTEPVTVSTYDIDGDPATPPQLFGSVTVARRPDAAQMLHPCFDQTAASEKVQNPCSATMNPSGDGKHPTPCQSVTIRGCTGGAIAFTAVAVPFKYVGSDSAPGRFWAHAVVSQDGCIGEGWPLWGLYLMDQTSFVNGTGGYGAYPIAGPIDTWRYCPEITWKPGATYRLQLSMQVGVKYPQTCPASIYYKESLICPGPAVPGESGCGSRSSR